MSRHEESQGFPASDGHQQVGYRKPPAAHQFKPGQSGNPKGRPRKARTSIIPKAQGVSCRAAAIRFGGKDLVSMRV